MDDPRIPNRLRIRCPHCGAQANCRKSEMLSPLLKELTFICTNFTECGHVFVANLEVVRTLSLSAVPNPDIHIQLSPHIRFAVLAAQLDMFKEQAT